MFGPCATRLVKTRGAGMPTFLQAASPGQESLSPVGSAMNPFANGLVSDHWAINPTTQIATAPDNPLKQRLPFQTQLSGELPTGSHNPANNSLVAVPSIMIPK
jgi:hypothetical protein